MFHCTVRYIEKSKKLATISFYYNLKYEDIIKYIKLMGITRLLRTEIVYNVESVH